MPPSRNSVAYRPVTARSFPYCCLVMLYQAESCPAAADILAYDRTYIHARSGFLPVIIGFLRRVPVVNTIFYIPVVNRVSVCAISHGASRHALSSLPCWQIMTINSRLRHLSLSWGLLAFDPCAAHLPIRSWQTVSTLAGCPYREIAMFLLLAP